MRPFSRQYHNLWPSADVECEMSESAYMSICPGGRRAWSSAQLEARKAQSRRGWHPERSRCPMIEYMTEVTHETQGIEEVELSATGDDQMGAPSAVEVAEAWLAQLADQISVPASDVQDHLLDLWGALDEGPARSEVERWLTETLRRNLYSVSDINERLEVLLPAS